MVYIMLICNCYPSSVNRKRVPYWQDIAPVYRSRLTQPRFKNCKALTFYIIQLITQTLHLPTTVYSGRWSIFCVNGSFNNPDVVHVVLQEYFCLLGRRTVSPSNWTNDTKIDEYHTKVTGHLMKYLLVQCNVYTRIRELN